MGLHFYGGEILVVDYLGYVDVFCGQTKVRSWGPESSAERVTLFAGSAILGTRLCVSGQRGLHIYDIATGRLVWESAERAWNAGARYAGALAVYGKMLYEVFELGATDAERGEFYVRTVHTAVESKEDSGYVFVSEMILSMPLAKSRDKARRDLSAKIAVDSRGIFAWSEFELALFGFDGTLLRHTPLGDYDSLVVAPGGDAYSLSGSVVSVWR